jgi:hypothetical protein
MFDGSIEKDRKRGVQDLGASPGGVGARPNSGSHAPMPPLPSSGAVIVQDVLNEASQSLGLVYREQAVDGPSQPKLEELLALAAQALQRGLPVAVALGPAPGSDRRLALLLQVQSSGKSRAFQLFDVLSQEIAWINEGDLLARSELPFSSKSNRRITRVAVPTSRSF